MLDNWKVDSFSDRTSLINASASRRASFIRSPRPRAYMSRRVVMMNPPARASTTICEAWFSADSSSDIPAMAQLSGGDVVRILIGS